MSDPILTSLYHVLASEPPLKQVAALMPTLASKRLS